MRNDELIKLANEIKQKKEETPKLTAKDVESFSFIVDHLIGENKQTRVPFYPVGGIPQMPRSREEILISSFFESCAFKSTAACVVGNIVYLMLMLI